MDLFIRLIDTQKVYGLCGLLVPRIFAECCVCGRSLNYDESSENGPLYPACLLNFEIRK